jgi:radical SAM protein with 4Fe4S-binding SPASM domain
MNNESAYLDYLDTVLKFVKKGIKETGIIFELRLWNFEDASLVLSEANQKTLTIIENALDLQESITFTVAKGKGIKLKKNVYLSKGYEFEWPDLDHDLVATKGTCYGLRQQIAVLSSGDVVPCCLDGEGAVTLGNIFESEFESIVTSSRASAIVSGFENNQLVEELCMRCGYRERFN